MKRVILTISALLIVFIAIMCVLLCFQPRVEFDNKNTGTTNFTYRDKEIKSNISSEHLEQIVSMFENKKMKTDSPSCGFTKDVSIEIDNKTFCIACDTCGKVYLFEEDKYFSLDEEENESLRNILECYGFEFPCI